MDSMIKEINENLKAIVDTIRENRDNSINVLDNIQNQMDKKVDEAKKYKIQVDSAKERIKELEDENKSLESSLNELNDKYSKMNLVSIIEAGNKEIKNKINDNLKNINKEKEHIAELTNKARTIKDLLINLKKDKTLKEEKLENIKVVYEYFNDRISEITDYAFDHANNLSDYKSVSVTKNLEDEEDDTEEIKDIELENTMVFDEIANIDENRNFKDEMTFINDQIDDNMSVGNVSLDSENTLENRLEENIAEKFDEDKFNEIIKRSLNEDTTEEDEENQGSDEIFDTTQVFDTIFNNDESVVEDAIGHEQNEINELEEVSEETTSEEISDVISNNDIFEDENKEEDSNIDSIDNHNNYEFNIENLQIDDNEFSEEVANNSIDENNFNSINTNLFDVDTTNNEESLEDKENEDRINKINDLFSTIDDINTNPSIPVNDIKPSLNNGIENQIDNAYKDVFGVDINENDLNKIESTLTDIFGNPIKNEELSEELKKSKQIEELFNEYGIDFNRFREDEKNYLRQIYDEEKYTKIIEILNKNKINLDNIYNAFNIFGEISPEELDSLINKLINNGQSVEAIGIVLEKLPKLKKYNLDEAILSYGDYVKDVDITELIMKAKELYDNGGNR